MTVLTVYSHHAQERIKLRHLSQHDIELTLLHPDKTFPASDGQTKYLRQINGRCYQVIAKDLPAQNSRLVVSAWVRGEDDPTPWWVVVLTAPFMLLWVIARFLWKKMRPSRGRRPSR